MGILNYNIAGTRHVSLHLEILQIAKFCSPVPFPE